MLVDFWCKRVSKKSLDNMLVRLLVQNEFNKNNLERMLSTTFGAKKRDIKKNLEIMVVRPMVQKKVIKRV